MRKITHIVIFTLCCFLYFQSFSQNELLTFNYVPPPPGFHPGSKACVQDKEGYMWIGTYQAPLRRYDGYHYTFYSNNPADKNSLAQNWVEALYAGRNGIIWIGTADSGLDRLDPLTGQFQHFRFQATNNNSLSSDHILTVLEDKDGMLWIGTANGLNIFNPATKIFKRFYHDAKNPCSLSCNKVEKIYEDRRGDIWVGTGDVWNDGGKTEGGLNHFNKKTNNFTQYLHQENNSHSLINNKVKAIFEDSKGVFWVGTAGDGLHIMDRTKGTFERLLYDPANPGKLSRPSLKQIRPNVADHITFIIEDASNAIWIGTFGNGLNRYDPKTNNTTHYPFFKDATSGMQLEVAWWACNSRDGVLWIGYWRGIYRIDPLKKKYSLLSYRNHCRANLSG